MKHYRHPSRRHGFTACGTVVDESEIVGSRSHRGVCENCRRAIVLTVSGFGDVEVLATDVAIVIGLLTNDADSTDDAGVRAAANRFVRALRAGVILEPLHTRREREKAR